VVDYSSANPNQISTLHDGYDIFHGYTTCFGIVIPPAALQINCYSSGFSDIPLPGYRQNLPFGERKNQ